MGEQRTQHSTDLLLLLATGGNDPLQASIYLRSLIGAKTAADLLFHFDRPAVPFRLVVSKGTPSTSAEARTASSCYRRRRSRFRPGVLLGRPRPARGSGEGSSISA